MDQKTNVYTPADFGLAAGDFEVQVSVSPDAWPDIPIRHLAALALWSLQSLKVSQPAELSIRISDPDEIRRLNREYRNIDKSTDVLSFGFNEDDDSPPPDDQPLILGDVVICPAIADRVTYYEENQHLLEKLEILVIHGILHLLGFDHESAEDYQAMESVSETLRTAWARRRAQLLPEITDTITTYGDKNEAFDSEDSDELVDNLTAARLNEYAADDLYAETDADDSAFEQPLLTGASPDTKTRSSLLAALRYAADGIMATVTSQRNMQIHLVVALLVVIAGFILRLMIVEWAVLLLCIFVVLAAEMLNTAIEVIVDMVSPQQNPQAGLAKDISAGVVLLFAICSVLCGLLVFVGAGLRLLVP